MSTTVPAGSMLHRIESFFLLIVSAKLSSLNLATFHRGPGKLYTGGHCLCNLRRSSSRGRLVLLELLSHSRDEYTMILGSFRHLLFTTICRSVRRIF